MSLLVKKSSKSADELVTIENIKKSWISFVIVTVFFSLIFRSAWWILFPIVGTLVAAIQKTVAYYTTNAKCPNCKSILDEGAQFCRNCGIQVMQMCPTCNIPIKSGGYCDKCGASAAVPPIDQSNAINAQSGQNALGSSVAAGQKNQRRFCPACGVPVDANTTICGSCGFTL